MNMKWFFVAMVFFMTGMVNPTVGLAQSTLAPGEIAVIEYRGDSPDGFGFIALVEIEANTEIHFTDKGWDALNSELRSGENVWTWKTTTAVTQGSVITCQNDECSGRGKQAAIPIRPCEVFAANPGRTSAEDVPPSRAPDGLATQ